MVSRCVKCGEFEPQSWDYETEGIWLCDCKSKESKHKPSETLKELEVKYNMGNHGRCEVCDEYYCKKNCPKRINRNIDWR